MLCRTLCRLGKYSTNWATSSTLKQFIIKWHHYDVENDDTTNRSKIFSKIVSLNSNVWWYSTEAGKYPKSPPVWTTGSSLTQTHQDIQKSNEVSYTCGLRTQKVDVRKWRVQRQPGWHGKTLAQEIKCWGYSSTVEHMPSVCWATVPVYLQPLKKATLKKPALPDGGGTCL